MKISTDQTSETNDKSHSESTENRPWQWSKRETSRSILIILLPMKQINHNHNHNHNNHNNNNHNNNNNNHGGWWFPKAARVWQAAWIICIVSSVSLYHNLFMMDDFVPSRSSQTMGRLRKNEEEEKENEEEEENDKEEEAPPPQHHHHHTAVADQQRPILTMYLESPDTLQSHVLPLPNRTTTARTLIQKQFPHVKDCSQLPWQFPVHSNNNNDNNNNNDFADKDPFLPWIHDYFVVVPPTNQKRANPTKPFPLPPTQTPPPTQPYVQFVAQNKRRCHTGANAQEAMTFWEPQMALFQPVSVTEHRRSEEHHHHHSYYTLESSPAHATYPETRFLCHFHTATTTTTSATTASTFPFNYEYVGFRKRPRQPMFATSGRDVDRFEYAQLLFACPIPSLFQPLFLANNDNDINHNDDTTDDTSHSTASTQPLVWLDVIPIRTPARRNQFYLTPDHVGPDLYHDVLQAQHKWFNAASHYGTASSSSSSRHVLPPFHDSGRWANLPICRADQVSRHRRRRRRTNNHAHDHHHHRLVVCTWTAAQYHRRGDTTHTVRDSEARLREWIVFHRLVGVDHLYIYDNTLVVWQPTTTTTTTTTTNSSHSKASVSSSPLQAIAEQFADFVTYIPWGGKLYHRIYQTRDLCQLCVLRIASWCCLLLTHGGQQKMYSACLFQQWTRPQESRRAKLSICGRSQLSRTIWFVHRLDGLYRY